MAGWITASVALVTVLATVVGGFAALRTKVESLEAQVEDLRKHLESHERTMRDLETRLARLLGSLEGRQSRMAGGKE